MTKERRKYWQMRRDQTPRCRYCLGPHYASECPDAAAGEFDDENSAMRRMATLTGICLKCGDGGWWIDDSGHHYCDCPFGVIARQMATKSINQPSE